MTPFVVIFISRHFCSDFFVVISRRHLIEDLLYKADALEQSEVCLDSAARAAGRFRDPAIQRYARTRWCGPRLFSSRVVGVPRHSAPVGIWALEAPKKARLLQHCVWAFIPPVFDVTEVLLFLTV